MSLSYVKSFLLHPIQYTLNVLLEQRCFLKTQIILPKGAQRV